MLKRQRALILYASALSLVLLICAGCEKNPPTYIPREAKGRDTAVHYDTQAGEPRFLKIRKKDAQSKEAVARRRELKAKVKDNYRRGAFFD